jgi:hypothetical protein
MNKIKAVQLFSLIAIAVGVVISYFPPTHNSEAIWALISGFLGYASRDLFATSTISTTTTEQQP